MGQCGCGDMDIEKAYRLSDGTILAYQSYAGCRQCSAEIGFTLFFFPPDQKEWLEYVEIEEVPEPDA